MGGYKMIILLAFLVDGVFGADPDKVSVNEGEPVTLNCAKNQKDVMHWYFNDILIAHINGHPSTSCFYDGESGIFRGRLKMDNENGSLIITNIRPEHAGRYEAELIRSEGSGTEESLNGNRKCDSTKILRKNSLGKIIKTLSVTVTDKVSVNEGESVTLHCAKEQKDVMHWYFNDILIAHINGHPDTSCFYDGESGIFRNRLKVGHENGSLIITNIRPEHAGRYEAELIRSEGSGTEESLNGNRKCDSTKILRKNSLGKIIKTLSVTVTAVPGSDLSAGAVAGIVVAILVVFAAAVGVIYYRRSKSRKRDEEKRKPELLLKV